MKLYFEAEKFLKPTKKANGSLQSRIFNDKKLTNSPKHIFALVYSTIKYKEYIDALIRKSKIKQELQIKKVKASDELLALLIHDLLFSSKGRIQSGKHPIKDAFLSNKTRLQAEFTKLKLRYKVKSVQELPTKETDDDETPIRWFRINTIKIDPERFYTKHPFFKQLQPVSSLEEITGTGVIYSDDYIPNLFGVHPKEKITNTDAYKLGEIIIQDRASCFPSHILNSDPKDIHTKVIDACAAPGNKTTHAAAHLPSGTDSVVYAFERDPKRVQILKTMCEKATGKNKKKLIQITHADFTTTKPDDFAEVTGLVVDPSCSGSGIFGRALESETIDTERLQKLAGFQFAIMKHALSFPSARKVVYSTCSVHVQENEKVVIDLLSDAEISKRGWKLATRDVVLPSWERRGFADEFVALSRDPEECEKLAGGCVRANPKEDGGIGFFAACFVRTVDDDEA
ncbi:RCM1 25S rRNA [Candida maltosa Xu316]